MSTDCECNNYPPVELTREAISNRIKVSRPLRERLTLRAQHAEGYGLLICEQCQQYWQSSLAWQWQNKAYLYQVPAIATEQWEQEPYMAPDQMLLYSALMDDYFQKNHFVESAKPCQCKGCSQGALTVSVLCLDHFIENLQSVGLLPKPPKGRIFPPYRLNSKG